MCQKTELSIRKHKNGKKGMKHSQANYFFAKNGNWNKFALKWRNQKEMAKVARISQPPALS